MKILAGDIGGTNTRLAIFEENIILVEEKYKSKDFSCLEDIVSLFLKQNKSLSFERACFGVAGPVMGGQCIATNLPWIVDEKHLMSVCQNKPTSLLNDLEAKAYGIKVLKKEELFVLQEGKKQNEGNRALIAAGTGLGEAGMFWDGKEHRPFACEGGHSDFGPRNDLEVELWRYLQKQFDHVSYERIVSGPGIYTLYKFLIDVKKRSPSSRAEEMMKTKAPPLVISELALRKVDPLCEETIDLFLSLYGAEAGNMALKIMALGGVYIGGGIAPHLMDLMKNGSFIPSFLNKGRFKSLLETIPIYIILNDDASLLGACYFARSK